MLTVLSILGIYLVGVLAAIIIIAWVNAHDHKIDEVPSDWACLSWIAVFFAMFILIAYPFAFFYDWCYNKFEKSLK